MTKTPEERLATLESQISDMRGTWDKWISTHDVNLRSTDHELYRTIENLTDKLSAFVDSNVVQQERLRVLESEQAQLKATVKKNELGVHSLEIYSKSILDELQTVNLSAIKQDINVLHTKQRKGETEVKEVDKKYSQELSKFKTEVFDYLKQLDRTVQAMKTAAGKYAIRAWIWVLSIVFSAAATGLIGYFIAHARFLTGEN